MVILTDVSHIVARAFAPVVVHYRVQLVFSFFAQCRFHPQFRFKCYGSVDFLVVGEREAETFDVDDEVLGE